MKYFNQNYEDSNDAFASPASYDDVVKDIYYYTPKGSYRTDYDGRYGSYYEGDTRSYYDGRYGHYYTLGTYDDGYTYDSTFDASLGHTQTNPGSGNYYNGSYGSYYVGATGEYYDGAYGAYYDGTYSTLQDYDQS